MVAFFASKPRLCIADLSSFGSIVPGCGFIVTFCLQEAGKRRSKKTEKEKNQDNKTRERERQRRFKPDPSVSNRLNASRISSISSLLNPGRSYVLAAPRPRRLCGGKKNIRAENERARAASSEQNIRESIRRAIDKT